MSSAVNPTSSPGDRRSAGAGRPGHAELVARQKEEFGGMKFGCSFFGWLTATGTAVLLSGLLAVVGTVLGLAQQGPVAAGSSEALRTIGLVGGIALLVVILLAYFCGGYVAARMARFSGLKQGFGVWLWAIIAAIVVAVLSLIAGSELNLLNRLNGVPIPLNSGTLTTGGIITAVALAAISLVGALLGGAAGMRYHRRVDRHSFDDVV